MPCSSQNFDNFSTKLVRIRVVADSSLIRCLRGRNLNSETRLKSPG